MDSEQGNAGGDINISRIVFSLIHYRLHITLQHSTDGHHGVQVARSLYGEVRNYTVRVLEVFIEHIHHVEHLQDTVQLQST